MHSLMGRPHRVKHLRLLSPEVYISEKPVGILVTYGDNDFVEQDIQL